MILTYEQIEGLVGKTVHIKEKTGTCYLAEVTQLSNTPKPNDDDQFFIHLKVLVNFNGQKAKNGGKFPLFPFMQLEHSIHELQPTSFPRKKADLQPAYSKYVGKTVLIYTRKTILVAKMKAVNETSLSVTDAVYFIYEGNTEFRHEATHQLSDVQGATWFVIENCPEYEEALEKLRK